MWEGIELSSSICEIVLIIDRSGSMQSIRSDTIGGMNSFWGPVVGAIFLVLLREYLPGTGAWENIFYGTTVVIALFFLPGGIVSLPRVVRQKVVALKLGRMQNKQGENRGNTSGQ